MYRKKQEESRRNVKETIVNVSLQHAAPDKWFLGGAEVMEFPGAGEVQKVQSKMSSVG